MCACFLVRRRVDRILVDGKVAFLINDSVLCMKLSSDICDASDGSHIRTVPLSLAPSHDHFYTLVKVFPGLRGSASCFILSQTQAEKAACPIIAVRKRGEHSVIAVDDY